ncbi:hypothetical protein, partial [Lacticaseibacillus paracasei]|uniref:hypothetical protein n=1 Tax=Lacticaseibacillus paracasei TaxID=1597 RepID=UPI001ED8CD40
MTNRLVTYYPPGGAPSDQIPVSPGDLKLAGGVTLGDVYTSKIPTTWIRRDSINSFVSEGDTTVSRDDYTNEAFDTFYRISAINSGALAEVDITAD